MTLGQKRRLFTRLAGSLEVWLFSHPGWELQRGEGYVALTDRADGDYDGPHKNGGAHYTGLGQDYDLFIDGQWIRDGSHPVWRVIGSYWKSLHPLCRWGGDFRSGDSNHFSLEHEGRA